MINGLDATPAVAYRVGDHEHRHRHRRQRLAAGDFKGSTAMSRVLAKLVKDGRIAREVALSAATDVEGLKKLLLEKF